MLAMSPSGLFANLYQSACKRQSGGLVMLLGFVSLILSSSSANTLHFAAQLAH